MSAESGHSHEGDTGVVNQESGHESPMDINGQSTTKAASEGTLPKYDSDRTMNPGWLDPHDSDLSSAERASVLHEFGHVLGMLHEHQSSAGGGVPLKNTDDAIKFYGVREGWDPEEVKRQVLETYNEKDVNSFSEIDQKSIMQYPMPAAVTDLGHDIDDKHNLSDLDKAYITIMYPRVGTNSEASEWTLDRALEVTGIAVADPASADRIRKAAVPNEDGHVDPTEIREIFSHWTRSTLESKNHVT